MNLQNELKRGLSSLNLEVDAPVIASLLDLQDELQRWNKTYNLTAITDPGDALEKHLIDSLTLLPYLDAGISLLDIGSGAGFPGLPLKIARPDLQIMSVDAVAKKIRFQKHIVRRLRLAGFTPWHGRAEEVSGQDAAAGGFDLVVARAFASIPKLIELAMPCLKPGGMVLAMKGPEGESELAEVSAWLQSQGINCHNQVHLRLPVSGSERQLLFFGR